KARKLMISSSGRSRARRLRKYMAKSSFRCSYFPDVLQRMLVYDVLINALDFGGVEIIKARVKINRHYRRFLGDQNGFGLLKQLSAQLSVGLHIGLIDELVITAIFPAGAVVAAAA